MAGADERDVQERVTACWNSAASSFDSKPGHGLLSEAERRAWLDVLERALPPPPGDVLDIGTGTGFMAFRAHELGYRIAGTDLAADMLAVAKEAASHLEEPPVFQIGDAIEPAFAAGSFDVVMNRHLLWTLHDPGRALRNWRRLLRPGGVLFIVDGIWPPAEPEPEEPDGFYTPEVVARLPLMQAKSVADVIALIESAGFGDIAEVDLSELDRAEGELDGTRGRYALRAMRG